MYLSIHFLNKLLIDIKKFIALNIYEKQIKSNPKSFIKQVKSPMRQQQFIRFVQEICFLLKLSQPCSKTALQYFMQFKEYENHGYDQEILVAACIYLAVKIFQEEVRIRDILNMVYVLTSLYRMSAQQAFNDREMQEEKEQKREVIDYKQKMMDEKPVVQDQVIREELINSQQNRHNNKEKIQQHQLITQEKNTPNALRQKPQPQQPQQPQQKQPYISLKNIQHLSNLHQLIQPKYSLTDYNQYKGKIIQAQQMLLRILGFSFSLSEQNKKQLKRLLIMIHHLRVPSTMAETIIKVYNDLHYISIDYWPEGILYFGYLITKVFVEERQRKKISEIGEKKTSEIGEKSPQGITINLQIDQKQQVAKQLELKEFKSTGSQKNVNNKETLELTRINQFVALMTNQKWQSLLATDIKQLQNYAQKLTNFYSSIQADI